MLSIEQRLRILLRQRPLSAAQILADALRYEAGPDALQIARAALHNGQPPALAAVVEQLHRLPAMDRRLPSISRLHLSDALRRVISRRSARACVNAVEVIAVRADPALAYLLPPLIASHDEEVAEAAAAALLGLAVITVGDNGRRLTASAEHRDLLDDAVARAAAGFRSHRRREALLAAALCISRPGPRLSSLLEQRDSMAVTSLRAVPGWMEQPLVAGNLVRWLGHGALRRAVSNWLPRLPRNDLQTFLRDGHLLRTAIRRTALREVSPALACTPRPDTLRDLPPSVQVHVPVFISRLNLSPRVRVDRLAACAQLPSPVARWRALEALEAEPAGRGSAPVRAFCRDEEPVLARVALSRLRQWGELQSSDEEALVAAGHGAIAAALVSRRSRRDVLLFRERFMDIAPLARVAAARRLLATDRGGLLTILHEMVLGDERPRRQMEAMGLIRRLSLVPAMEGVLSDLTGAADVQVAATAVACLGDARSRRALDALRASLRHPNHRILANAIEALGGIAPREAARASRPLAHSPANRVRGNAVRLILKDDPETGVIELRCMLRDRLPIHQISGIWVARHSRRAAVVDELKRLSNERWHPEVQVRASGALRFLEAARRGAIAREEGVRSLVQHQA